MGLRPNAEAAKFKLAQPSNNQKIEGLFDNFQVMLDIHTWGEQTFLETTLKKNGTM